MSPFWREPDYNSPEYEISGTWGRMDRFRVEHQKLLSAFSTVVVAERGGVIESIAGSIEPTPGTIRDFLIRVPSRYPYEEPKAYSVGWQIQGPHHYGDSQMCLWRSSQWKKSYSLAYAVAKTFTFIHKHEAYVAYGVWPGNEQKH